MIYMRVCKNDMIDSFGLKSQIPVHTVCLKSLTLKHTAVEQQSLAHISGYQMFTSGHFPGCTNEFYFHEDWILGLKIVIMLKGSKVEERARV